MAQNGPAVTLKMRLLRSHSLASGSMEPGLRMNKLIFANLLHRPVRSIISVLAVAIEVIMMLTIIAIMLGQLTGQKCKRCADFSQAGSRAARAATRDGCLSGHYKSVNGGRT